MALAPPARWRSLLSPVLRQVLSPPFSFPVDQRPGESAKCLAALRRASPRAPTQQTDTILQQGPLWGPRKRSVTRHGIAGEQEPEVAVVERCSRVQQRRRPFKAFAGRLQETGDKAL